MRAICASIPVMVVVRNCRERPHATQQLYCVDLQAAQRLMLATVKGMEDLEKRSSAILCELLSCSKVLLLGFSPIAKEVIIRGKLSHYTTLRCASFLAPAGQWLGTT